MKGLLILPKGSLPPPGKKAEGRGKPAPDEDDGPSPGRIAAANDIIKAIKAGDGEALDAALADHYEMCAGK